MYYGNNIYVAHAELYHHGIKGQKWGVRRFQNEDGSLTAKGIKRYAADADINSKKLSTVARIRTGEARRKLDIAKENNSSDVKQLKKNLKLAKKSEKQYKRIEKGQEAYEKGHSVLSNYIKAAIAVSASATVTNAMRNTLATSGDHISLGKGKAMVAIAAVGAIASTTYAVKKTRESLNMHKAMTAKMANRDNVSAAGGQEYKDRKKMGQYKG